jgi:tetratricopeptide (TPR) repeat protein
VRILAIFPPVLLAGLIVSFCLDPKASAHGFVHEQIETVSRKIDQKTGDARLLLKRAELLRDHEETDAARADLQAALALEPGHPGTLLALARLQRETNHLAGAHKAIDTLLAQHQHHPGALKEKALIHAAAEEWMPSASAWKACLQFSSTPEAESFLACAHALRQQKSSPDNTREALAVLLQGVKQHPGLIPLRQAAAACAIALHDPESARTQFDALLKQYPTLKPRLYTDEAEAWLTHGQFDHAHRAYQNARSAFDMLPPSRRNQPGFQALGQRITRGLASAALAP